MHDDMWDRERERRKWPLAKSALLVLTVVLLPIGAVRYVFDPFFGQVFTRSAWKAGGSCEGRTDWKCVEKESACPRGRMVWTLQTFHIWPRWTSRTKVVEMLGSDWRPYDRTTPGGVASVQATPSCIQWNLGMCSGLGMDYDFLAVCFDSNDMVEKSFHYQG